MENLAQKYSPSWYWNHLGFTVVRNGVANIRTVYDNYGRVVCHAAGYEGELSTARFLANAEGDLLDEESTGPMTNRRPRPTKNRTI